MQSFVCYCGARIFFENTRCMTCFRELAFMPWKHTMTALEPAGSRGFKTRIDNGVYRKCRNYLDPGVCNWLVPSESDIDLCQACQLNRVVPDLSLEENLWLWATMEAAKRRLLYSLNRLGLPVRPGSGDGDGLTFDIKQDTKAEKVQTGHAAGLITLNLSEANPVQREENRIQLNERYRTPLGHFRHESGHYYWDLLVRDSSKLPSFRELFGHEQTDYQTALRSYYERPRQDWRGKFVSAYASSHPWEDWAETWAHYLHTVDSLDTAFNFGMAEHSGYSVSSESDLFAVITEWSRLSIGLNAINRSMGLADAYPFEVSETIQRKLAFVHQVIAESV